MTKITYPVNGLMNSQSKSLEGVESGIGILSNVTFDIPDGISDSVLETFPSIVEGFSKELQELKENINQADNNYKKLNENISKNIKYVDEITIPTRDPIV